MCQYRVTIFLTQDFIKIMYEKKKSNKGKLVLLIIVVAFGFLSFKAMQDVPPPLKDVTKVLEHEALKN